MTSWIKFSANRYF